MTAAYIARNPVSAGLVESPIDWPWGSHAAIEREVEPTWLNVARLESYFAAAGGVGRKSYLELVEALIQPKRGQSPFR